MKQHLKSITILVVVTLLLAGCGVAGLSTGLTPTVSLLSPPAETPAQAAPAPTLTSDTLAAIEGELETIYAQVNPAVVSIQVTQKQQVNQPTLPNFPGFRFFFGPQGPQTQPNQPQAPQEFFQHGAGSGFVWDKAGHIITNNHVVEGADKITVTFADDTTVPAEVVGTDPDSDLAVLKVDLPAERLQPVQLADSSQVKVGQLAVAIGNPFALENTMTVGFISAIGRSLPATSGDGAGLAQGPTYTIPDIIQTDAPINPGNSGGVLVDDQGQVIGVTAAIESPVRASAGIGFAIPSAIVDKVVPELIKAGHYDHPWLGLSGMSLTPELAQAMDLNSDQRGALVIEVTPASPADQAGLQGSDRQIKIEDQQLRVGGDVIVAIDGQPVKQFDDVVTYLVRHTEVKQQIELTVLRDGKEETVKVTLAGRPGAEVAQSQTDSTTVGDVWLGIQGLTVTPEIAQAMDLPADQSGVLVEQVELGSPADTVQLRGSFKPATINGQRVVLGGDVITAIDGQPLSSLADLQAFIQQAKPDQQVTLTVLRDGQEQTVPVTLSERAAPAAFAN